MAIVGVHVGHPPLGLRARNQRASTDGVSLHGWPGTVLHGSLRSTGGGEPGDARDAFDEFLHQLGKRCL